MYAYIKGKIDMKLSDSIIIETGGVGYKIYMTKNAIEKLGNIGDVVKIHTHYYVREDNISLYGFMTSEELRMFELLIQTSGIGAKSALTILANIEPYAFALAIITNNDEKLIKIPGIGKKTAARMILELKDKMKLELEEQKLEGELDENVTADVDVSEAISALQVLGYNRKEIEKAFEKLDFKNMSVEDMIRKGLALLSRE